MASVILYLLSPTGLVYGIQHTAARGMRHYKGWYSTSYAVRCGVGVWWCLETSGSVCPSIVCRVPCLLYDISVCYSTYRTSLIALHSTMQYTVYYSTTHYLLIDAIGMTGRVIPSDLRICGILSGSVYPSVVSIVLLHCITYIYVTVHTVQA